MKPVFVVCFTLLLVAAPALAAEPKPNVAAAGNAQALTGQQTFVSPEILNILRSTPAPTRPPVTLPTVRPPPTTTPSPGPILDLCSGQTVCCANCQQCFGSGRGTAERLFACFLTCEVRCPPASLCVEFDARAAAGIADAACAAAQDSCSPRLMTTTIRVTPQQCFRIQFGVCVGTVENLFPTACRGYSRGRCTEDQFRQQFDNTVIGICTETSQRVFGEL